MKDEQAGIWRTPLLAHRPVHRTNDIAPLAKVAQRLLHLRRECPHTRLDLAGEAHPLQFRKPPLPQDVITALGAPHVDRTIFRQRQQLPVDPSEEVLPDHVLQLATLLQHCFRTQLQRHQFGRPFPPPPE